MVKTILLWSWKRPQKSKIRVLELSLCCLYVIFQFHVVHCFVPTLVTGVSWFFVNCLNVIFNIAHECSLFVVHMGIIFSMDCHHMFISCKKLFHSLYIDSSPIPWCAFLHVLSSFSVVLQFESFFTGFTGVLHSSWIVYVFA